MLNNNNKNCICFAVNKIMSINLQCNSLLTRGGTNNAPAKMSQI